MSAYARIPRRDQRRRGIKAPKCIISVVRFGALDLPHILRHPLNHIARPMQPPSKADADAKARHLYHLLLQASGFGLTQYFEAPLEPDRPPDAAPDCPSRGFGLTQYFEEPLEPYRPPEAAGAYQIMEYWGTL